MSGEIDGTKTMTAQTTSLFSNPFANFDAEALTKYLPNTDSVGVLARGAMEASTASARAQVKGMQDAGQAMLDHAKGQIKLTVETGKKLSAAESFSDAMTIQTGYVKTAFEKNVNGFNDLADLYTDTLIEAFAPLAKQAKKAAKSTKAD